MVAMIWDWASDICRCPATLAPRADGIGDPDAMEFLGIILITAFIMLGLLLTPSGEVCEQCNGRWMNLYGGGPCPACNRGIKR